MIRRLTVLASAALLALVPLAAAAANGTAPLFTTGDWLNATLAPSDLRGKVVIVDVFTFGCINCKHVTPELRKLHATLSPSSIAIVGVHAPETPEERDRANVAAELKRQGITWPVAVDNGFTIWRAFGTEYWPTQYIFDRHGALRKTVVGEGQDALVESTVRALLAER